MKAHTMRVGQKSIWREVNRHRSVYFLLFIPLVYYIIFKYFPIWNGQIAFRDFMPLEKRHAK
jgi:putative aldouronate transport system permease protein